MPSLSASSTLLSTPVQAVAGERDWERAIHTLALAFENDPAVRWMFPDSSRYPAQFPAFVRAFGGRAFEKGTAYVTEDFAGAALWLGPGVSGDEEAVIEVVMQHVPAERLDDAFAVFGQMDAFHPEFPHWYLPLVGVDPARQGNGLGTTLLRHVLDECDRAGLPAYLESSSLVNLPLYERHGFRVMGEIQAGTSPTLYPMIREIA